MSTNSALQAALVSNPVPPDLQCVLPQATADAIAQVLGISGLASQVPGSGIVVTNNVAQQALAVANAAQAAVTALAAQVPKQRGSTTPQPFSVNGDNQVALTWNDLGTNNYIMTINIIGPAVSAAAYFGWRIVSGTQSSTGIQLYFENVKNTWSFTWNLQTSVVTP